MSEYSKLFKRTCLGDYSVDNQLNRYLGYHPGDSVKTVSYSCPQGTCLESLFVVFTHEDKKTITGEQTLGKHV